MKNFWHMQLHPDNRDWDLKEIDNILLNHSVIGMGKEWDGDGGEPERFMNNVNIGDIVVIRHWGAPRYLVEVIGECKTNEDIDQINVWFELYRKVKILSDKGPSFKDKYKEEKGDTWTTGLYAGRSFQTANNWDFAKYWYNNVQKQNKMDIYLNILKSNHNLILTGAPGTGKTYLAKQIAEQMGASGEQCGFVQFHPSYDYTDFIEGLRPIKEKGAKEIGFQRKDGVFLDFCRKALIAKKKAQDNGEEDPSYVFIIDEINRGEISKIFGELFFSVDNGYRGKAGRVMTQYSNLWDADDLFDTDLTGDEQKKFYVPDNVYIIGTMNDIDRSVESMDFAMRRRFAWKEITAKSRQPMLNEDDAWGGSKPTQTIIDEIKIRMDNLNAAIIDNYDYGFELSPKDRIGLTMAYQIGAAYFLKYALYSNSEDPFEDLWTNHLKGLLYEYLRGTTDIDSKIDRLHQAYNDTIQH